MNTLHSNINIQILLAILYISSDDDKENLCNNQELLQLEIISRILMIWTFDSAAIM